VFYDLPHRAGRIAALAVGLLLLPSVPPPAWAVINPRFTPRDLVKGSSQVWVLRVGEPQGKTMSADVMETLKGKAPEAKQWKLGLREELEEEEVKSAFGSQKTATAILFLSDKDDKAPADEPNGALQIGTTWFAVVRQGEKLALDKDKRDLFAVWAGSAPMLVAATRYVQSEPAAQFPVRSETSWGESLKLGKLAGPASACLVVELGKPAGLCVIVLSEAGDRVYRAARSEGKPSDVTAQLKLATASKAAVVGDFDGDGRGDLISWDGRSLWLAAQTADGTFAAPRECGQLADCLSLDCIDVGGPRPALVAGTSQGPVLLAWNAGGTLVAQPLGADKETLAKLGPGGLCAVADFNGDGRPDVMALFAKGALLYAGEGPGRFKTAAHIALPLVGQPRSALCGDFDTDGLLDVVVAGNGAVR
jgi:hypothetical protein